jgi:hypothetical protein
MWITVEPALSILNIENSLPKRGRSMKKQILIVTAVALTAAVVILNGTSAATAQQTPQTPQTPQTRQYQVGGFPISPLQMSVLQPSAKIKEQQRLSRQPTMDASRRAGVRDFGIGGNTGY